MAEFLDMGGYAAYVWPAYGVFAAVLGGLAVWSVRRNRQTRQALEEIEGRRRSND